MKKVNDYRIEINVLDMISTSIHVTKEEFDKKLRSVKRQVAESQLAVDTEFRAEEKETVEDFEQYVRKTYRATLGTTDIELIEVNCKPGYMFKK